MARTKTLAELRSLVANQADIVGASARYTPTLLNGLINQSIQHFRERISLETEGARYLTATSGTLSVGATSPYPFQVLDLSGVSPGLVRTFGVDLIINGQVVTLQRRPFHERAMFGTQPSVPVAWAHFQTDKIAILPAPATAYSYTVWYLPVLSELSSDAATFDGVAGWEDYIVWDVFSRLVVRDNESTLYQQATDKAERLFADILRGATQVSHAGGAHKGRDTFGAAWIGTPRYRAPVQAGGGVPSDNTVTNQMLAHMAARRIKANLLYEPDNPQDATGAEVAGLLPSFAGTSAGLVPTGTSNPLLFLSQGGWSAPSVGGAVTGLSLSQIQDIAAPAVLGRFGSATGPVLQMSGGQVASMVPWFTTTRAGLVPVPSGGAQGYVFSDSGEWVAQSGGGGGGGGPTMLAAGSAGSVQYNGGSGFAAASGFAFQPSPTGLVLGHPLIMPSGFIQIGPASGFGFPTGGLLRVGAQNVDIAVGRSVAGLDAQFMQWGVDGPDILTVGRNSAVAGRYNRAGAVGHHWAVQALDRVALDATHLSIVPGVRFGLGQLALPDSVGDKLGAWTASGFANIATGINITASGTRLTVGSGGPQLHASGIDMRSSDIRNVRRINNLDGIKVYGDLPDADANITSPSGTVFIIPFGASSHTYSIVPSGAEHGEVVLIENRSGVAHSINQTGTGMGAPSGFIATLAPSGGFSAKFESGAWTPGVKYKLGGF